MRSAVKVSTKLGALVAMLLAAALLAGCDGPSGSVKATIEAQPRQGRAPLEVTFDASGSYDRNGEITDYLWDFGDGTGVHPGKEVRYTFERPGDYSVILRVVGSSGVGSSSTTVRVGNNPPRASFTFYPRDPFDGEPVEFDGSESYDSDGTIVRWAWDFGDGDTQEGEFAQHKYKTPGDYTVRLTVEDEHGDTDRASRMVKVEDCNIGGRCGRR